MVQELQHVKGGLHRIGGAGVGGGGGEVPAPKSLEHLLAGPTGQPASAAHF